MLYRQDDLEDRLNVIGNTAAEERVTFPEYRKNESGEAK